MTTARKIATILLETEAVKLSPANPFTWSSGWKSPIYCDNRITLSDVEGRTFIKKALAKAIKKNFPEVTFYTDENKLPQKPFDLTLINTPPHSHKQLLSKVTKRGDSRIFIEKPFGGHLNYSSNENYDNVFIGYVLRFNPCVQWIKSNIVEYKTKYLNIE